MNFITIMIVLGLISLASIGLVIWLVINHQKHKLIDEAQTRLALYCREAGILESRASIARSTIRNMVEFGKANAGMIASLQAQTGILALLAKNMGISTDEVMRRARVLKLPAHEVLNALANISDVQLDLAKQWSQKTGHILPQADLPRELDEAEQEQVIGGMTPEADDILKHAAAGDGVETVEVDQPTQEADPGKVAVIPPAFVNDHLGTAYEPPSGMKVIYLNLATRKFASRAFAKANPDQVEMRLVPALN